MKFDPAKRIREDIARVLQEDLDGDENFKYAYEDAGMGALDDGEEAYEKGRERDLKAMDAEIKRIIKWLKAVGK